MSCIAIYLIYQVATQIPVCASVSTSGDTLCRDNCQLIGMPFFYTRSAGKNNRN